MPLSSVNPECGGSRRLGVARVLRRIGGGWQSRHLLATARGGEADENWTITSQLQGRYMATSFEVEWKELGGWWLADFDLLYSDDQGLTYLPVQSGILQDPENAVTKLNLGELHATGFMVVLRNPPSSPLWPIGVAEFRVHGVARR